MIYVILLLIIYYLCPTFLQGFILLVSIFSPDAVPYIDEVLMLLMLINKIRRRTVFTTYRATYKSNNNGNYSNYNDYGNETGYEEFEDVDYDVKEIIDIDTDDDSY